MNNSQLSHCQDNHCYSHQDMYPIVDYPSAHHCNTGYQYSHTVLEAPMSVMNPTITWCPTAEFNPTGNKYPAALYSNDTPPPEESLNTLLREQNDKYMTFTNTPLSPMSMRSVDTFDAPLSPSYHHSPSLYYAQNDDAYLQDYPHQQIQLQMQYELEHMQSPSNHFVQDSYNTTFDMNQFNYPQQHHQYHHQVNTAMMTPSTTTTSTTTTTKRKRNSGKRTPASQLICPTCSRKFSRPYNLKSHQRTHTNERPYVCHYPGCSWTFARPHDLKRHDLLHSGIKKYICSCGKPFARSDAFKRHQAVDKVCSLRKA
ncbi:uncharacterized protein EV154DRAFT_468423 [Mucor mucedo]|uniref:uncharacterized protein n=1 Tax=Mucor mucedo TaxID=29922 RepID=UPI00222113F5|nr:uncharacterized protein EV154DRAFT_468423 [Mucor mucedo]KAI7888753.1 hypothetical protein EV154DRAFT_468423 [Mucor mucedo]